MKILKKRVTMKEEENRFLSNILILWGVIILFLVLSSVHSAQARKVTLAWDPNDKSENVTGYKVYYRTCSSTYNNCTKAAEGPSPRDVPVKSLGKPDSPQYTLSGLQDGVYFFAVTAYSKTESLYSNEVSDRPVTLLRVSISGADTVDEKSETSYEAMAEFENIQSQQDVTAVAIWSVKSDYAEFHKRGVLKTSNVSSSQTVTIKVRYTINKGTDNEITKTSTKQVTIANP
ncbi:MAG: fibronectin type III domain-containing protein [Deltaproteobacteria bacterium]|nr:fibronectin type III domain-containing protein [Deltaproteobacteria bacterium]